MEVERTNQTGRVVVIHRFVDTIHLMPIPHRATRLTTLSRHLSLPSTSLAPALSRSMSWHANFPTPKSSPAEISARELDKLTGTPGVDYIVVDVRRTDIVGVSLPLRTGGEGGCLRAG